MYQRVTRGAGIAAGILAAAFSADVWAAIADGDGGVEIPPAVRAICIAAITILALLSLFGWVLDKALEDHAVKMYAAMRTEIQRAIRDDIMPMLAMEDREHHQRLAVEVGSRVEEVGRRLMNNGFARGYTARATATVPAQKISGSNVLKLAQPSPDD